MKVRVTTLSGDQGPHFEILGQAGFEVSAVDRSRNLWNPQELIAQMQDCVAIVAGVEPYTPEVLEALPNLRVVSRTGVGFDSVDLATCDARNIAVTTTPGVNHHAVAEHTIAMLLAVARGFPDRDRFVRQGTWKRFSTPRIWGSTLGVLGLGRIGKAVVERATGLGMQVLGYDPYADADWCARNQIRLVELNQLFAESDYVSLHLPVGPDTRKLMNRETLSRMKPGAILVNTARGALVDEEALAESLRSGHLGGAALDVFDVEPLPLDSPLLQLDRVLFSGHLAGLDVESQADSLTMAAENILKLYRGELPEGCLQNLKGQSAWKW